MNKNIWEKLKRPIIALAPMAGITDSAFRQICKSFGVDLVYTEMVSADGLAYKSLKTLELARFDKREKPIILQLFGKHPKNFAKAVDVIQKAHRVSSIMPDACDINMGCPARKVVNSGHGIMLMKNARLASEIVSNLKKATKLPISVKTRLGINDKREILTFGPKMERAGADALCVHARTYKQGFSGPVDLEIIKKLKSKIKIPIIVNGGIYSPKDAMRTLETAGADGIMIAQGALGQPWIFREIKKMMTKNVPTGKLESETGPSWDEIKKIALKHAKLAYKLKGCRGILEMRKHLAWYVKGRPNAAELRQRLVRVESVEDVEKIFENIIRSGLI